MAQFISGPGVGLPLPTNLYPSELANAPYDFGNNIQTLPAGGVLAIPAGRFIVDAGAISILQWLDPVTGIWRTSNSAVRGQPYIVLSDGFTRRVANLTGCPVAAVVQNGGSGFVQATAVINSNTGGSTWQPIVGGSLVINTLSNKGLNYGVTPFVFIPDPPNPGVPAAAYATMASGTLSSVSMSASGAGYTSIPTGVILPVLTDPNFATVTQATVSFSLSNAGAITAALCTNNGAALATLSGLTLTASGGSGTGASITPVIMQTVIGQSVVAGGGAFGTVA